MPVDMARIDPNKRYRIRLNKLAKHGEDLLRPIDEITIKGSALLEIEPQDAVEEAEHIR